MSYIWCSCTIVCCIIDCIYSKYSFFSWKSCNLTIICNFYIFTPWNRWAIYFISSPDSHSSCSKLNFSCRTIYQFWSRWTKQSNTIFSYPVRCIHFYYVIICSLTKIYNYCSCSFFRIVYCSIIDNIYIGSSTCPFVVSLCNNLFKFTRISSAYCFTCSNSNSRIQKFNSIIIWFRWTCIVIKIDILIDI